MKLVLIAILAIPVSAVRAIQEKTVHWILKNVLLTRVSKVGQAMKLPMILYASVQWTIPANDAAHRS